MYTVPCPECVQVTAIEWKRLGAWDGWLGLGMMNTHKNEKELLTKTQSHD